MEDPRTGYLRLRSLLFDRVTGFPSCAAVVEQVRDLLDGRRRVGVLHFQLLDLELVESLGAEPALKSYHLLPSVKGDLLLKLGRRSEARAEFERAASLTRNERERGFLLRRAKECTVEH